MTIHHAPSTIKTVLDPEVPVGQEVYPMKLTLKNFLREFQRTYDEIEKIAKEKAESEKKHDEFLQFCEARSEAHRIIQRVREIIRNK